MSRGETESVSSESQLEKFVVDFVLEKLAQRVRLHLDDEITVRPVKQQRRRKGTCSAEDYFARTLQWRQLGVWGRRTPQRK